MYGPSPTVRYTEELAERGLFRGYHGDVDQGADRMGRQ